MARETVIDPTKNESAQAPVAAGTGSPASTATPAPASANPAAYDPTSATPYTAPEAPQPPAVPAPPKSSDLSGTDANRNLTFGGGTKGVIGTVATLADSILKGAMKGRERKQAEQAAKSQKLMNGLQYANQNAANQVYDEAQKPGVSAILTKQASNPKYQLTPEEQKTIEPYQKALDASNSIWQMMNKMQANTLLGGNGDKKGGKGKGKKSGGADGGEDANPIALMTSKDPNEQLKGAVMLAQKAGNPVRYKVREMLSKMSAPESSSAQKEKLASKIAGINAIPTAQRTPEQAKELEDATNRYQSLEKALAPPVKPSAHPSDYAQGLRRFVEKEGGDPDNPTAAQESAFREARTKEVHAPRTPSKDDKYIDITSRYSRDPKSITPDEAAFISAYDQWVKKTKTDPGVARMAALANTRYIPIVDPNDPNGQNVVLERAGEAAKSHASLPASAGFQAEKKVLQSATSGKLSETLNYFNTAVSHLSLLSGASKALENGNITGLNKIGQAFAAQTGSAAPITFDAIKSAVVGEVAKTFQGGRATQSEIKTLTETINRAQSPEQLRGAIGAYTALLNSKRDAVQQQIKMGLQGKVNLGGGSAPPTGATGKVKGSDGKQHWTDGKKDLGVAE